MKFTRTHEMYVGAFVSFGAAVVIFGAWQKILHLPMADTFLTIGLLVEALIFLIYGLLAFTGYGLTLPKKDEEKRRRVSMARGDLIPELPAKQMENFERNLRQIAEVARQMADVSEAVKAAQHFGQEVNKAASAFSGIGSMVQSTSQSVQNFKKAADQLGSVGDQTKQLTQNITALNQVYQTELQNSANGIKSIGSFYTNLASVADALKESAKDAQQTQKEISTLSNNLANLNEIYGNMLAAMKK